MANPENDDFAAVTAQAVARAQTEERSRISAINGAEASKIHPKLAAAFVAAGTATDVAVGFLNAAAEDTKAAVDAKKPDADPAAEAAARTAAFEKKKKEDGALGLGTPDSTEPKPAGTGWGKAIASANRRVS